MLRPLRRSRDTTLALASGSPACSRDNASTTQRKGRTAMPLDARRSQPVVAADGDWHELLALGEDVARTIAERHVALLQRLHALGQAWLALVSVTEDCERGPLDRALLDAHAEFMACAFLLLHGFYSQALRCLRSALELAVMGAFFELAGDTERYARWVSGKNERNVFFKEACDWLMNAPVAAPLEKRLHVVTGRTLFAQGHGEKAGRMRRLFRDLSAYSHTVPGASNYDLWRSNGPIYVFTEVERCRDLYCIVQAYAYVAIRLARVLPPDWPALDILYAMPAVRNDPVLVESARFFGWRVALP